jgi:hypothetical protein
MKKRFLFTINSDEDKFSLSFVNVSPLVEFQSFFLDFKRIVEMRKLHVCHVRGPNSCR